MAAVVSRDHAVASTANGVNGHSASSPQSAASNAPAPTGAANVSSQDAAERAALQNKLAASAAGGANVLSFDEDATPEQKAAAAQKQIDAVRGPKKVEVAEGFGLASDIGGKRMATTITLSDIDRTSKAEGQKGDGKGPAAGAPTLNIPEDAIVGHTGMARFILGSLASTVQSQGSEAEQLKEKLAASHGNDIDDEDLQAEAEKAAQQEIGEELLRKYLPNEAMYGQWWWDAVALILAAVLSYFIASFVRDAKK